MPNYLSASGLMMAFDMPVSKNFFRDGERYLLQEKSTLDIYNNDRIFFLHDGLVSINCVKEPQKTVFYLGNNGLLNEPYINDGCMQLRIRAISHSELYSKSTSEFVQALKNPAFYREVTTFLGAKLVNLMRQMKCLRFQDAGKRVENFEFDLIKLRDVSGRENCHIHIAQEAIAKTVGLHRVTVAKARRHLALN